MEFMCEIEMRSNDPRCEAERVREALGRHAVVHIKPGWHLSDLRGFYDVLTEGLGGTVAIGEDFTKGGSQTGEKWMEIRYDAEIPDMVAFRHSKNAQPFHTDESYIADPADIMFFYCVNRALHGGATTFIFGPDLVNLLREYDASLLTSLLETKIRYRKADQQRTESIIRYDNHGQVRFNFNYFCVDKTESPENIALNQRFHDFLQERIIPSPLVAEVALRPGEAVAWWDELVLHGRRSFVAEKSNDRFIWKTGIRAA